MSSSITTTLVRSCSACLHVHLRAAHPLQSTLCGHVQQAHRCVSLQAVDLVCRPSFWRGEEEKKKSTLTRRYCDCSCARVSLNGERLYAALQLHSSRAVDRCVGFQEREAHPREKTMAVLLTMTFHPMVSSLPPPPPPSPPSLAKETFC